MYKKKKERENGLVVLHVLLHLILDKHDSLFGGYLLRTNLAEIKHPMDVVLDESRSFFRVHTGYFSNIPKCIKAEFIASWACSQSSVVSSSKR
ncbi:hypothetical protein TNCV_3049901 [Trichonephila clavipes]|nr:hypothetical protein TNCV_3049901 [Trichonephila clavipes]